MNAVQLEASDLALLERLTPDLSFTDAERQEVLLENASRDFNAVPGSGKTSILAAKLLLLARKWPHSTKGLCVLSHTNVAREEIVRRLSRTDEGPQLLGYPHFIGTIHGFVNQFLALPALRAIGLPVDVIDDDVFASRALAKLQASAYYTLRAWLSRKANGDLLVKNLFYKGANLALASDGGDLPSITSNSGKQLAAIKLRLAQSGVFRHRDMFAFALAALDSHPDLLDVVHRRFPMVFVDEMQDTSWEQEDILNRLFDGRAAMQRFGDVDQKIILDDEDAAKTTFPRTGHGSISTSKRFGSKIATAIAPLRLSKLPVEGEGREDISPVLLLYPTELVGSVVEHFGKLVAERFCDETLRNQAVRAMCARKSVQSAVGAGRDLCDYWPPYAELSSTHIAGDDSGFWSLVDRESAHRSLATLTDRTNEVRKALLLVLQASKAAVVTDVRDARNLPRAVAELLGSASVLQELVRKLVLYPALFDTPEAKQTLPAALYKWLHPLLPDGLTHDEFIALNVFAHVTTEKRNPGLGSPTRCSLAHCGRELDVCVGTVASMKGETHFASLVLESYGGKSRRFDLELALPVIADVGPGLDKMGILQQRQMRNLYVAMSRPTHFLCLAANAGRVTAETLASLSAKGWLVEHLSEKAAYSGC